MQSNNLLKFQKKLKMKIILLTKLRITLTILEIENLTNLKSKV
jgi:hypothetical protein